MVPPEMMMVSPSMHLHLAVFAFGHAVQRRAGFALGAGGQNDQFVIRHVGFDVYQQAFGHFQIAQVAGQLHVLLQAAAGEGHFTAVFIRQAA